MSVPSHPSDAAPSPIDCATAVRRLWDYLDGRLSAPARDEVEAHLATCEKCPPHFEFAERIKASLAAAAVPAISREEEARLRERVRGALQRFATGGDDDGPRNSS
jgi:anti-sigma factor (TIGR02949 family)